MWVDIKDCQDDSSGPQMFGLRGCLHVQGEINAALEPRHTSISDEVCFCDYDLCNERRCETEFCSCAFSDPYNCRNITERKKYLRLSKVLAFCNPNYF